MHNPVFKLAWAILGRRALEIDADKCVRCGKCARICHHGAIEVADGRYAIQTQRCRRCCHCVEQCPRGAIHPRGRAS